MQRRILARYHVQNPQAFYGGQDFWQIPNDPTGRRTVEPPYYLSVKLPDQSTPGFSLTSTFVPKGKVTNLTAFMAVDSVPTSPTYGEIRILQVPRSQVTPGPEQVQNTFENNPTVSQQLTLLRGPGSQYGRAATCSTLPFGGGFLYVEPVYLQANAGAGAYPLLKRVLVSYGNDIGFGATLEDALNQVLKGGGVVAAPTGTPLQSSEDVRAAIDAANKAYTDAPERAVQERLDGVRGGPEEAEDRAGPARQAPQPGQTHHARPEWLANGLTPGHTRHHPEAHPQTQRVGVTDLHSGIACP